MFMSGNVGNAGKRSSGNRKKKLLGEDEVLYPHLTCFLRDLKHQKRISSFLETR